MNVTQKLLSYKEEMLEDFKELLKIESKQGKSKTGMPFGEGPHKALAFMLKRSKDFGLTTVNLDNYIGYSEYGEGDEYVCSLAHLDVVPEGEGWDFPPFSATESDGYIYARGASDDKPGNIVGLYLLRAMKELEIKTTKRVRIIYGCNEETGMADVDYYLKKEPLPYFGISPDIATHGIINAEKSRVVFSYSKQVGDNFPYTYIKGGTAPNVVLSKIEAEIPLLNLSEEQLAVVKNSVSDEIELSIEENTAKLTFIGISAHAATPQDGKNAAAILATFDKEVFGGSTLLSFIDRYISHDTDGKRLGIACTDEATGPLTFNIGTIELSGDEIEITVDVRYPATKNCDHLKAMIETAGNKDRLKTTFRSSLDGYQLASHKMFKLIDEACVECGLTVPERFAIGGGTYSRKFSGRMVSFSGCGENYHAPNERVLIEDFYAHAKLLGTTLYKLSQA